jgi:hypothetical protein
LLTGALNRPVAHSEWQKERKNEVPSGVCSCCGRRGPCCWRAHFPGRRGTRKTALALSRCSPSGLRLLRPASIQPRTEGLTIADYDPPAVDKLIAAGAATTNAAQRFAIYSTLLRTLASDVPYVPLYLTGAAVGVSRNFTIPDYSSYFTEDVYALLVKPAT